MSTTIVFPVARPGNTMSNNVSATRCFSFATDLSDNINRKKSKTGTVIQTLKKITGVPRAGIMSCLPRTDENVSQIRSYND